MSGDALHEIYERLVDYYGQQHWWPADSPFEVMVGAVLTQNTNWRNVVKALDGLKGAGLLELDKITQLPQDLLAAYIRPAGYHNLKAGRLLNLCRAVSTYADGSVEGFLAQPMEQLRESLLAVKGVGPETADAIILYAAGQPIFVVDAYTYRVLLRHNLIDEAADYHTIQEFFMSNFKPDAALFNEYHALFVQVGKDFCRKKAPDCANCPLEGI